jgi:hypothetical protein
MQVEMVGRSKKRREDLIGQVRQETQAVMVMRRIKQGYR